MPNWTTPAADDDESLMLSDRWQREHRTISRKADDCESEDERGDVSRSEGSEGVWIVTEEELISTLDAAAAMIIRW